MECLFHLTIIFQGGGDVEIWFHDLLSNMTGLEMNLKIKYNQTIESFDLPSAFRRVSDRVLDHLICSVLESSNMFLVMRKLPLRGHFTPTLFNPHSIIFATRKAVTVPTAPINTLLIDKC